MALGKIIPDPSAVLLLFSPFLVYYKNPHPLENVTRSGLSTLNR